MAAARTTTTERTTALADLTPPSNLPTTGTAIQKDLYRRIADSGADKADYSFAKTAALAFMGGAFVSFGCDYSLTIAGNLPSIAAADPGLQRLLYGVIGFPVGASRVCIFFNLRLRLRATFTRSSRKTPPSLLHLPQA